MMMLDKPDTIALRKCTAFRFTRTSLFPPTTMHLQMNDRLYLPNQVWTSSMLCASLEHCHVMKSEDRKKT